MNDDLTKESFIATKEILIPEIYKLKEFYSDEVIEYLYGLIALECTGLEDDGIRKFLSNKKEFYKYFNYNFWYRTMLLIQDMGNNSIRFNDGDIMINENHIASVCSTAFYRRSISFLQDNCVDINEPFEVSVNYYTSCKSLEELRREREGLLEKFYELDQILIVRSAENSCKDMLSYMSNLNSQRQEIISKLDILDRLIISRVRNSELYDNPIYNEVANKLLGVFDSQDDSKFVEEHGSLVKRHPHLSVSKIKY